MRLSKIKKFLVILIAMIFVLQFAVSARVPYQQYNYNETDRADTFAAVGYTPDRVIDGNSLGIGNFNNTSDVFVASNEIYIVDANNNRLVVLNLDFTLNRTITLKDKEGNLIPLSGEQGKGAQGVFVDEKGKRLFISKILDTQNGEVYVTDLEGNLIHTITRPETDLIDSSTIFQPKNALVDEAGMIYVSAGMTNGALRFNQNYEFQGFYGYQTVALTPQLAIELFWRRYIFNDDAVDNMVQIIPVEFKNIDIGKDGYIYTIANDTDGSTIGSNHAQKLNSLGNNVFRNKAQGPVYGDRNIYFDPQIGSIKSNLIDICVDDDGFVYVLDSKRGRVFMYSQDADLLSVFGGNDTTTTEKQIGMFHTPTSVDTCGEYVLVTDDTNNVITVFKQTDYMKNLKAAIVLDDEGLYEEAGPIWQNVIKYDQFSLIANEGLSKYYLAIKDYDQSLNYSQKAFYWTGYSLAFKEYRDSTVANLFPFILLAVVILILVPIIINQIKAKKYKSSEQYGIHRNKTQYLKYCLFHPFKAYGDMKYEKKGSVLYATIIVGLVLIIEILSRTVVGFLWDPSVAKILYFNLSATIFTVVGGFFLWTLCNWAITTLFDGEGKFSEIWTFSAYAFMPRIVCMIPIIILSRIVSQDELQFLMIIEMFMYIWLGISIVMAIKEVHQYTMKKTILAIVFTVLGMILVICIGAIVYSMFVQLISFVTNIFNEISLRI